jgi:hypothetical protein
MLVIYTMERDVSVAARQAIESGQDFGDVANRFNITGSLPPGGDLGMLSPGSLVNPLDELLRTAPLNQIVGPVASPGEGWFLVKVIERERREQPAPETQVPIVREMIRQRKVRTATIRAIQKLKHSYALKVTPSGPQDFYARMQMSSAEQLQGLGSAILPMEPRPGDANIVLATWDEGRNAPGRFTVADALSDLQRPDAQQPVWSSTPAIRSWIENRALRQVILAEGHRRLIHEEPDVRRSIQGRVDNAVIENLYQTDIIPETQATEEQVRAFFDTVKDRFQRLDEITIDTVTLPDSPTAQTLATHASHAATLADALAMAKTSGEVKRITVSFPSQEPRWQQLESMFTSLPPGGAGGPVTMEAGSMVFKVVSKVQPQMTFEELPPNVVSMLRERASDVHRDQVLRKHTEHYRKMYSPVLKPELLKKIPWPIDPPTASLQVTKPAGS